MNKFSIPSKSPPAPNSLVKSALKKSAFGIIAESIGINKDCVPASVVAITSTYNGPGYESGPAINIIVVEFLPPVPTAKLKVGLVSQGVAVPSVNVLLNLAVTPGGKYSTAKVTLPASLPDIAFTDRVEFWVIQGGVSIPL